jgi:hypothetical protein
MQHLGVTAGRRDGDKRTTNIPALPVKNTFFPSSTTILSTFLCSSFNVTIFFSFLLLEDTDTRGAKNESRVLRGTLTEPGLKKPADGSDLRFLLAVVGLSGLAGGIEDVARGAEGKTRSRLSAQASGGTDGGSEAEDNFEVTRPLHVF